MTNGQRNVWKVWECPESTRKHRPKAPHGSVDAMKRAPGAEPKNRNWSNSWSLHRGSIVVAYHRPIGSIYHFYTNYIALGYIYIRILYYQHLYYTTYHLLSQKNHWLQLWAERRAKLSFLYIRYKLHYVYNFKKPLRFFLRRKAKIQCRESW